MSFAKRINALQPSATMAVIEAAARLREQGVDVISFGAGEPDFDTPDHIIAAANKALAEGHTRYTPGSGTTSLKRAIAKKLKKDNGLDYESNQIVVSNGGKHSLFNIMMTLFEEGDEVVLLTPYWVTYPEVVKLSGAKPVYVETREADGFQISREQLLQGMTGKTKGIIVNTPSNPSGAVLNRESLQAIVDVAKEKDLWLISDECYEALVYGGEHLSLAGFEGAYEKTITVQTMSKAFAMTGWRMGYSASSKELASAMGKFQGQATGCPNSIAQYASEVALTEEPVFLDGWRAQFIERRNYMVKALNQMPGISCLMPEGAFYAFPKVSDLFGKKAAGFEIKDDTDLTNYLLDVAHVTVVPGSAFGAAEHIRLSYATSMDAIKTGLGRFAEAVAKLN
ncbi:MAG: pyridoxal phosphate-dependent aminotransferase [Candidatus Marinimicrobia bacterium]|nr:pyridoxal phosphate-dependent aminotransferase [Candidatus Neomarinimicrobiota bacterium]MCF7921536.1 pyridoxal phosphate-dependent aminotransferase [Candidatus Neomarinimicrobiota bacterium]